ncbi:MAG: toxin-antitoxin system HicB family antitoxin [Chloroflexi bacterium]|nr:toxin-antitoxin system HicB family antitoxin [Chloroflexota bacterium]
MKKDKNIMVRVSKEMHAALKQKAAAEKTTISEVCRYAIELFLKDKLSLPKDKV